MRAEIIQHYRSGLSVGQWWSLQPLRSSATSGSGASSVIANYHRTSLTAVELLSQSLPAFEVLMIKLRTLKRQFRWLAYETSFEHEGQCVVYIDWLQLRLARLLKSLRVGAMAGHAIVQAGSAGHKTFSLRVIFAAHQAHELVHEVAMEPWWSKGMFRNHPSRR